MPPSRRRRTLRHGRSPRQVHPQFFAFRPAPPKADPHVRLATSFSAKVPQPFVPAPPPALPQTRRRCLLRAWPPGMPPPPETAAPSLPAFHLSQPQEARGPTRLPACFQIPARAKSSPIARKSPPPSRLLFSESARRFRCLPARRRSAPPLASPFHTHDASAFARDPSD